MNKNEQKYFAIGLGLLASIGLVLELTILIIGDDGIKLIAASPNLLLSIINPVNLMILFSLMILLYTIVFAILFSLVNLASDMKKLKKALISIGAFTAVVLVAFFFSNGTETPLKNGDILSALDSKLIETGIRTFYFLVFIAVGAMLYSGIARFKK